MTSNIIHGIVQSGGTSRALPLQGATVQIIQPTVDMAIVVASGETDAQGRFKLTLPETAPGTILLATATLPNGMLLVAVLGVLRPERITINELTTVAAGFSFAQFIQDGTIAGNAFALGLAAGMNHNLVSIETGAPSSVLTSPPNGDQTNSLRSTRSLANLLSASVQQVAAAHESLISLTTPPSGTKPANTLQAVANIARNPGQNVTAIYQQSSVVEMYSPPLFVKPDAWTIAVKVNDTGDLNALFAGTGNVAFDKNGYAWITNNVVQGTPFSTTNVVVLQPNGKPSTGTDGAPPSVITGGGILGTGFGIAIDQQGDVWIGNFGWGSVYPSPDGNGSVSKVSPTGQPLCSPKGIQGGTDRVQGVAVDQDNNVWFASFGNNRVVVFPNGDPNNAIWAQEEDLEIDAAIRAEIEEKLGVEVPAKGAAPFDIAIAQDGSAWVTNGGGLYASPHASPSSVAQYVLEDGKLACKYRRKFGHAMKGISIDSLGNIWMASGGDNTVYMLDPSSDELSAFTNGVDSPWSVTVDGDDNVWVANFGPMGLTGNNTTAYVSKLAGANPETRPPGLNTGDPISPAATGFTLPSAGEPVTLANGNPLYGPNTTPCYSPLMRQTNIVIDQAGNAWATNNWKPSFRIDVPTYTGNPGGDGMVIFVGAAAPPKTAL